MKGGNKKGVNFAYPVAWQTPQRQNIICGVVNNAERTLRKTNAENFLTELDSKIPRHIVKPTHFFLEKR